MDYNVKIKLIEFIKLGFGLYIGKELGKTLCEKCIPVLKDRIKNML